MKLIVFSDLNSDEAELPKLEPDLVLVLGDIRKSDVREIDRQYACQKYGLHSNHDRPGLF
mgnify:CR=1 FL=1